MSEATLQVENEILREQIAQLKALHLGADIPVPAEWRLSPSQRIIIQTIAKREVATDQAVMIALYGARPDDWPSVDNIHVLVCLMKRKLAPFGVSVVRHRGYGWRLDEATRDLLAGRKAA